MVTTFDACSIAPTTSKTSWANKVFLGLMLCGFDDSGKVVLKELILIPLVGV